MSEEKSQPKFDKGDRAAIVSGRKGVGIRGEVFWIGPNKYGPGMRYGLKGDDGQTHWLDESEIGPEAEAPPAPPPPPAGPVLAKGDRAEIVSGKDAGKQGEVFWTGQSRYSDQMRYGIKDDDGETYWVDQPLVKKVGGASEGARRGDAAPEQGPPNDDGPWGGSSEEPPPNDPDERRLEDDLPPEALGGGDDPDFFNDPDEEIPF